MYQDPQFGMANSLYDLEPCEGFQIRGMSEEENGRPSRDCRPKIPDVEYTAFRSEDVPPSRHQISVMEPSEPRLFNHWTGTRL